MEIWNIVIRPKICCSALSVPVIDPSVIGQRSNNLMPTGTGGPCPTMVKGVFCTRLTTLDHTCRRAHREGRGVDRLAGLVGYSGYL